MMVLRWLPFTILGATLYQHWANAANLGLGASIVRETGEPGKMQLAVNSGGVSQTVSIEGASEAPQHRLVVRTDSADALHDSAQSDHGNIRIPNRLLFNHAENLLHSKTGSFPFLRDNVHNTIDNFHPDDVDFVDDEGCAALILEVHSEKLVDIFRQVNGCYKSDICRVAQVFKTGGYYSDTDMEFIADVRQYIPHGTAFATVVSSDPAELFQSFIAATPHHPILMKALNITADISLKGLETVGSYLEKDDSSFLLGPFALRQAWEWWTGVVNSKHVVKPGLYVTPGKGDLEKSYILSEEEAEIQDYNVNQRSQRRFKEGCLNSRYLVRDPTTRDAIFWSRIANANCGGKEKL